MRMLDMRAGGAASASHLQRAEALPRDEARACEAFGVVGSRQMTGRLTLYVEYAKRSLDLSLRGGGR